MKVLGVSVVNGEYEGRKYHNLVFQVAAPNDNPNKDVVGDLVDTVKIKFTDINIILQLGLADQADVEKLTASAFSDYIGSEISVSYNKYGAVNSITVVKSKSELEKLDTQPKKA